MPTKGKPPAKPAAQTGTRHPRAGGVEPGDHVYVHHPEDGPMAVRVLACGRDGFTGECEAGRRHRVGWDRMLGHKSRVKLALKVLDAGQEGAIVEDERGKRRFLAGDLNPGPEESAATAAPVQRDPLLDGLDTLAKALDGGGVALLLKAGAVKNAPGLALKDVTDRRGFQTKRWVRTMQDQPKPRQPGAGGEGPAKPGQPSGLKHGDVVTFRHGKVEAQGKIIASGRDGVTLRSEDGQTHQVRHDALGGKSTAGEPPAGGGLPHEKLDYPDHRPSSVGAVPATDFVASEFAQQHDKADEATVEAILKGFPPDTAQKMAAIDQRLRGITETKTQHFRDGAYAPERAALHKKIMDELLSDERIAAARPPEGEKPTFTILGGRGGSGKSWFKGKVYDPAKAIVLDADEIKHMLPEYEGWNAFQVHEESGDIFDNITLRAQELGLNIVHDATMKTASKAVATVRRFQDAGYRVEAHYMHLPRTEAARRAIKRFLGPTGRYVPPAVILGNTGNEGGFDQVKQLADRWSFRDNQGEGGPRLISEGGPDHERQADDAAAASDKPSAAHSRQDGRDGRKAVQPSAGGQDAPVPAPAKADRGTESGTLRKAAAPLGKLALLGSRVFFVRRA